MGKQQSCRQRPAQEARWCSGSLSSYWSHIWAFSTLNGSRGWGENVFTPQRMPSAVYSIICAQGVRDFATRREITLVSNKFWEVLPYTMKNLWLTILGYAPIKSRHNGKQTHCSAQLLRPWDADQTRREGFSFWNRSFKVLHAGRRGADSLLRGFCPLCIIPGLFCFETGFSCVTMAILELTLWTRIVLISLPLARFKGVFPHRQSPPVLSWPTVETESSLKFW